jgi:G3E family GTPase
MFFPKLDRFFKGSFKFNSMKPRRSDIRKQRPLIPIVLITGFLGAGKTTLLRKLAEHTIAALNKKPFIILNDYQNAKVDAGALKTVTQDITPIEGSCVCCDSRVALLDTLKSIAEASQAPDAVFIEVNGTSDAVELIEILTLSDSTQAFALPIHINVIDLYRWQRRAFQNDLERWQTAPANYIYYSRADRTDPKRAETVRAQVLDINAHAREITSLEASVITPLITHWLKADRVHDTVCTCSDPHHSHDHEHEHKDAHHSHHHLSHGFNAVEIKLPEIVDESRVQQWLLNLPHEILRVKGIFQDASRPGTYTIFQLVQGYDHVELMDYKGSPPISPTAVIIGQNLNPAFLQFAS